MKKSEGEHCHHLHIITEQTFFFGYVGSTKNLTFEYVGSTLRSDGLGLRVDYNDYVGNLHGMMMKR